MQGVLNQLKAKIKSSKRMLYFTSRIYNLFGFNSLQVARCRGNVLCYKGAYLKKCKIKVRGKNNHIYLGEQVAMTNCNITILGNNNEIVFTFGGGANRASFYIEEDNNSLKIGRHTGFCGTIHIAITEGTNVTIGDECLFSSEIYVRTSDSHSILNELGERCNPAADIAIDDKVWVGEGVKILKGAHIASHTVVATGSIVTKQFQDSNVILAGSPAKIVKEKIDWEHARI